MIRVKGNYFDQEFPSKFDGIVTDIPYKDCIKKEFCEDQFDPVEFMQKAAKITSKDAFLVSTVNMENLFDLVKAAEGAGWVFKTYQIWDKTPTGNFIAWTLPRRTSELIVYFKKKKGDFNFDFRDGTIKPGIIRSSARGELVDWKKREGGTTQGLYNDIVNIPIQPKKQRIHKTQKPPELANMVRSIVSTKKPSGQVMAKNEYDKDLKLQIIDDKKVLDPFGGSCNMVKGYKNSVCMDIEIDKYGNEPYIDAEKDPEQFLTEMKKFFQYLE
jgi:hypothetical protein